MGSVDGYIKRCKQSLTPSPFHRKPRAAGFFIAIVLLLHGFAGILTAANAQRAVQDAIPGCCGLQAVVVPHLLQGVVAVSGSVKGFFACYLLVGGEVV